MSRIVQPHSIASERVFASAGALNVALCRHIAKASRAAIRQNGHFSIVLTGGRTVAGLYSMLRTQSLLWEDWRVYWGDERCIPAAAPERNSRLAMEAWLDHVPIPRANLYPIPAELGAQAGAERYGELVSDIDEFDFVLLSLGEDGHVASVFPGADSEESFLAVAVRDAPKPPPQRVTLSIGRLARARELALLVVGTGKRAALAACRAGAPIPGATIYGLPVTTVWCDAHAATAGNGGIEEEAA